jgi:outer membrane protein OmpA-like peptidoglycan-associated protein
VGSFPSQQGHKLVFPQPKAPKLFIVRGLGLSLEAPRESHEGAIVFGLISKEFATSKKLIAIVSTAALTLVGLTSISSPASASTPFEVTYTGNTIGTAVPTTQTQTRGVAFTLPTASAVTGARTGYSFGGWSLTAGGASVASPFTYTGSSTTDNNRLDLHAVWNTTLTYNLNGSDSGALTAAKTSDTYRFAQTLTLPTAGTAVKSGYAFGGWLTTTSSTTRLTSYVAGTTETGDRTLYAAWIKTVSFNPNGATVGTIPAALTYFAEGTRLQLPVISEMTLRRPGYQFMGWSTSPTGSVTSNPNSYVPIVAQRSLFAIWKIQSTKATTRVFFSPGSSTLRAAQKLILRDLVDTLDQATAIKIATAATRPRSAAKSLGKKRNDAVVAYLQSLGVEATFTRTNTSGTASTTDQKNNQVTLSASWTN